jgi:periplasmic protein TonB
MPARPDRFGAVGPRERIPALVAAAAVQVGLALALLSGFSVQISRAGDTVERLIDVRLPPPPKPLKPKPKPVHAAAPPPRATHPGGSPGPAPHGHALIAHVAVAAAPPAGGGAGSGASSGNGAGGGSGGQGSGEDGGTDLIQIAGAIQPSDYPSDLRERGIGGRVGVLFTVGANGRVTHCSVTRPSGVAELDALTCRLIQQRFVYRPSTDASGRPIADEVEGEHDWIAARH